MKMSDYSWQHQKYARPEMYVALEYVLFRVVNEKCLHDRHECRNQNILDCAYTNSLYMQSLTKCVQNS